MDKWRYHPGVLELARDRARAAAGARVGTPDACASAGGCRTTTSTRSGSSRRTTSRSRSRCSVRVPRPEAAVAQWLGEEARPQLSALLTGDGWWHALEVSARSPERTRRIELHCDGRRRGARGRLGRARDASSATVPTARSRSGSRRRASCRCSRSSARSSSTSAAARLRARARPRALRPSRRSPSCAGSPAQRVTDATILIPTHRHATLLPYAVRSALDQDGASVEVFVVGDGVEDDTRAALEPFLADDRVSASSTSRRARGTASSYRHEALREADGRIVCYLSDDDLLLRGHVVGDVAAARGRGLRACRAGVDPARRAALEYFPWNYGRADFVEIARGVARRRSGSAARPTRWRRIAGSRSAGGRRRRACRPTTTCGASGSSCPASAARAARGSRTSRSRTRSGERAARLPSARRRSRTGSGGAVSRVSERRLGRMLEDAVWRAAEDFVCGDAATCSSAEAALRCDADVAPAGVGSRAEALMSFGARGVLHAPWRPSRRASKVSRTPRGRCNRRG